jgi:hypothetical protein
LKVLQASPDIETSPQLSESFTVYLEMRKKHFEEEKRQQASLVESPRSSKSKIFRASYARNKSRESTGSPFTVEMNTPDFIPKLPSRKSELERILKVVNESPDDSGEVVSFDESIVYANRNQILCWAIESQE